MAAVTSIYARAVTNGVATFELDPPDTKSMLARRQSVLSGGYPFIVAEAGSEIAGYAYASAYRSRPAYAWTVENSVYVDERFQRRGVGRALLSHLIEGCAAVGFRQMIAVIGDSTNRGSIGLHERLGFRMVGKERSVGWKHGRWLDTVTMQLHLGCGDESPPGWIHSNLANGT